MRLRVLPVQGVPVVQGGAVAWNAMCSSWRGEPGRSNSWVDRHRAVAHVQRSRMAASWQPGAGPSAARGFPRRVAHPRRVPTGRRRLPGVFQPFQPRSAERFSVLPRVVPSPFLVPTSRLAEHQPRVQPVRGPILQLQGSAPQSRALALTPGRVWVRQRELQTRVSPLRESYPRPVPAWTQWAQRQIEPVREQSL